MGAQITYIVLVLISLMINSYQHGKPKEGKHNVFVYLISLGISASILYWGGFFDVLFK